MNQKELLIKAAEDYINRGFSVVPVIGKVPCVSWKQFQQRRPTIEEFVKMCKGREPTGVAIITGKISGIVVVDVDSVETDSKLILPSTPTVRTSKGFHHYFKSPNEAVGTRAGFYEKVDIRGEGGYVVAPPSIHESGHRYEWVNGLGTSLAELPTEFVKQKEQQSERPKKKWNYLMHGVPTGQRHDNMVRIAGKFLGSTEVSVWDELIMPTLRLINERNAPPMDESEVRQIYESLAAKERSKRGDDSEPTNIEIVSLRELLGQADIESRFLIANLVPEKGINALSGHPGVGKSWVMLEMARAVASGTKFLSTFDVVQGPVLIVDGESGKSELKKRAKLLGFDETVPIYFASQQGIKVDDEKLMKRLLTECLKLGIKFVILDPFSAMHSKTENNAEEMQRVMEGMQEFTKQGMTVMFLHHHRKESQNNPASTAQALRGSSLILSRVDSLSVIRSKDEGQAIRIEYSQEKLRTKKKILPFEILLEEDESGMHLQYGGETQGELSKVAIAIEMIPELLADGGKTKKEIVEALKTEDIQVKTTSNAIKALVDNAKITRTRKGKENFYERTKVAFPEPETGMEAF